MSTRKVKDAIDLETDEVIYFKGHAKATYMSDGKTVEDALTFDNEMSDTSTNSVQNKVIKSYIDEMIGSISNVLDVINGEEI